MGEKVLYENGRISDFEGLVTLTLTLEQVILHTVMYHSCITHRPLPTQQISLKSMKLFVDGRTYGRADRHLRHTLLGPLRGVDLKRGLIRHSTGDPT